MAKVELLPWRTGEREARLMVRPTLGILGQLDIGYRHEPALTGSQTTTRKGKGGCLVPTRPPAFLSSEAHFDESPNSCGFESVISHPIVGDGDPMPQEV